MKYIIIWCLWSLVEKSVAEMAMEEILCTWMKMILHDLILFASKMSYDDDRYTAIFAIVMSPILVPHS
jgi:hypothetical protein